VVLNSGANTYTGGTVFYSGILNFNTGSLGTGGLTFYNGATLQWANNTYDISAQTVTFNSGGGTLDVNGQTVTLANSIGNNGAGGLTVTSSQTGGVLNLNGPNTYTGGTTVAAGGTLNVNNTSGSGAGSGAVTVNGTLGGTGTISGGVTVNSGGTFGLTGSLGGTLTLQSGATESFNSSHTLAATGAVTYNGNTATVYVPALLANGTYTLLNAPAGISGSLASTPVMSGPGVEVGTTYTLNTTTTTVTLTVLATGTIGTWTDADGATDHNWTDARNWSTNPKYPQNPGDAAIFPTGTGLPSPVVLNASESVGGASFSNPASYTISGANTLTLDNNGGGASLVVSAGAANAIQTPISLNDNLTTSVGGGDSLALTGNISSTGAQTLTMTGLGTNILGGVNTYGPGSGTVGTTLSAGTLQVGNSGALASGDLSVAAGTTIQAGASGLSLPNNILTGTGTNTLDNNGGDSVTLNGAISGSAVLNVVNSVGVGTGTLTLANSGNSYSGATLVNTGAVVSISADTGLGTAPGSATPNSVVLNGGDLLGTGAFALSANRGIGIGPGAGTNGGTALIDAAAGGTFTISGIIASTGNTGTDNLLVNSQPGSAGTVELTAANTFTGTTVVSNGILMVGTALALQDSTVNLNNLSGSLAFDGSQSVTAATFGALKGSQSLSLLNTTPGAITLTLSGMNPSAIYSGNLSDGGAGSGNSANLVQNGAGPQTLANANYTGNTTVNSNATLTISGGSFGSSSSTITVGSAGNASAMAATLNITGGTATADTVSVAGAPNESGSAINITGSASALFTTVNLGATGNTTGSNNFNSTGTVSLGALTEFKDANGTGPNGGAGMFFNGGNVTANSVIVQGTGASGAATMHMNGGTLTIGNSSSTGAFEMGGGATASRGGYLVITGGALTYPGTDGLLVGFGGTTSNQVTISGGVTTLAGITLDSANAATANTLSTTGGALYLGSVGLVDNVNNTAIPAVTVGGTSTLAAMNPGWSSTVPIVLTSTPTIQTADSSGVAWPITLSGALSGAGSLTVTGGGVLSLLAANTYSGATIVSNGSTLLVNNTTGSATGSNTVTVLNGAALGGAGSVAGAVMVTNGGITFPGVNVAAANGSNLFIGGPLTCDSGAAANFNLNGTYSSGNDQIIVTNNLQIASGVSVGVNLIGSATSQGLDTTADYVLITNLTGSISGSFNRAPVWLVSPPANAANFSIATWGNYVTLHYSPIVISVALAAPNPAAHEQLVTFSVNATSTGFTVRTVSLNATAIGGLSAVSLVQSNGTSIYTNSVLVAPATPLGVQTLTVTVVDSGNNTNTVPIALTIVASPYVWNGDGSPNNTWGDGANWNNGFAPGIGDFVTFAGTSQLTPDLQTSYTIGWLAFDPTAGAFNITNAAQTLTVEDGVTNNSANQQTLSVPLALPVVQTFNAATNNLIFATNLSGAGGVNLTGGGTNIFLGSNTFTGPTTLNTNGTLQLANTNALKGSGLTLSTNATLQLRADASGTFLMTNLTLQNDQNTLDFDVNSLTGAVGKMLSLTNALTFPASTNETLNVTGNSTYTLSLGAITLTSGSHTPYFSLNVNAPAGGPAVDIASVTSGAWGDYLNATGGGNVTITGNLGNQSDGTTVLVVNGASTVTLQGLSVKSGTGDAPKYEVAQGTLVVDNGYALTNYTTGTGLDQSYFILGPATNYFAGVAGGVVYAPPAGVLTASNNSFNAAVYLGDANFPAGGITNNAGNTNYVSDGDIGFTNSGVFTIGGQNTSGTNTYANPVILGWTTNKGKSVTLVAATGGTVAFTGGIWTNGTDTTAGVTAGDATHAGVVNLAAANTYAGPTAVNNGTLLVSGSIGNGTVAVNKGTLQVGGTIGNGGVIVNNGGTLLLSGGSIGGKVTNAIGGTLGGGGAITGEVTVYGSLVPGLGVNAADTILNAPGGLVLESGSSTTMAVSHSKETSDQLVANVVVADAGSTLTVITNSGDSPLASGDTFQLVNSTLGAYSTLAFSTVNLPALGAGLGWSNSLALNGTISVVSVLNPNPPTMLFNTATLGFLTISWPTNLGWILLYQSNSVDVGLLTNSTDWLTWPNSTTVTQEAIPISTTNEVFFQMVHP
jgi:autotransporter-associated beta strand protein